MIIPLSVVIFSLLIFAAIHYIFLKNSLKTYTSVDAVIFIILFSMLSYVLVIAIMHFIFRENIFSHVWVSLPIMMFLMMLYLQLYMGIDRSVSIRLMGDILNAPNKRLKIKNVQDAYLNDQMVMPRLDLLEDRGYIKKLDGEYICKNKGKILAKCSLYVLRIYSSKRNIKIKNYEV